MKNSAPEAMCADTSSSMTVLPGKFWDKVSTGTRKENMDFSGSDRGHRVVLAVLTVFFQVLTFYFFACTPLLLFFLLSSSSSSLCCL